MFFLLKNVNMEDDDVWSIIKKDGTFQEFLVDGFDVKGHASKIMQGLAVGEQIIKLTEGISLLDNEIRLQIIDHHDDLLSQATSVDTLEGVLHVMQTRIQSLLSATNRIMVKISEPYSKILLRTTQLRHLHETCDLLRRVIRVMYLSKRLHTQLQGGAREIIKAAQSLNELDYVFEGADLSGVEVIEDNRPFIKQARKDVDVKGQKMLEEGMETQNQAQVATSLQVFYYLGSLVSVVDKVVNSCYDGLQNCVTSCLDMTTLTQQQSAASSAKGGPGRASMPAPGNSAALRACLWTNMEKLMDSIYSTFAKVEHLQKVLTKKRHLTTNVPFIAELAKHRDGNTDIVHGLWEDTMSLLQKEFVRAAESSSFLKQTFEGEYPRLLRLYSELWRRMQQWSARITVTSGTRYTEDMPLEVSVKDDFHRECTTTYDAEKSLRNTLAGFENAYLSRSLSRLFDPINLVFASNVGSLPSTEEMENIGKTLSSELHVSSVDRMLSIAIARNVSKTVQLFVVKCEQLLCVDGDVGQVIGPATPGQRRNITVVNALFHFHQLVTKVLSDLNDFPSEAKQYVSTSQDEVVLLIGTAISPLLVSISDALQAIILSMHQEDFSWQVQPGGDTSSSLFMKELQEFVSRSYADYLFQFHCSDFIMDNLLPVAQRCVELFLRHASLVRPLAEGGRLKMAGDFAQMEMAISPYCRRVTDLGRSYRILRAVRPLLFQTPEHMSQSSAVGEIIPFSFILHFLFARASPELKSPHQVSDWSVLRYSQWLDHHPSETDRLQLIKGALEAYAKLIQQRQSKQYDVVYPVMLDILQRGLHYDARHVTEGPSL